MPTAKRLSQRDGIRQAGIGLGKATARTGPPDTNFFISVPIRSVPFSVPRKNTVAMRLEV
jgi:hypothetical protein